MFEAKSCWRRHRQKYQNNPPPPIILSVKLSVKLFQHCYKYADHKIFHYAFERGEFLSYNSAFLASISNTVLKGSGKENYSNIHYVKMTAVELLNFGADKFSFCLSTGQCNKGTCQTQKYFYFVSQVQAILQILIILFLL